MPDRDAITHLREVVGGDKETLLLHYLYFPRKRAAEEAAEDVGRKGYDVELRLGADGVNWLVLGRHRAVPTEEGLARARAMFEALAHNLGGEYDGWEAETE